LALHAVLLILFAFREVWQWRWRASSVSNSLLYWLEAWRVSGNITGHVCH